MIQREEYLITINSKNKIQRARIQLDFNPISKIYTVTRMTGQYGGKEVEHPNIFIQFGKAGRTPSEQATLQFNSTLKTYMDKGYKRLSTYTKKSFTELTEEEMKNLLNTGVTDTKGVPKPMLAKSSDLCASDIFENEWYCSCKLNGVRCLMYYKDGEVLTASRGGKHYNVSTMHIRKHPKIVEFFKNNPDIILDGEIYKHDSHWPLQRISGVARLQEWKEECNELEYWVYDYISSEPFKQRFNKLMQFKQQLEECNSLKIIDHKKLSGHLIIKKEHNKYVKMGFEGLVARNPDKEYGVHKRSALYMVKLKEYQDAEFKVCGVREGLREEDMCFELQTNEGKIFGAKPMGDVALRTHYLNHAQDYIGKYATCKFFEYSNDKVPQQPILIHFRPEDE